MLTEIAQIKAPYMLDDIYVLGFFANSSWSWSYGSSIYNYL